MTHIAAFLALLLAPVGAQEAPTSASATQYLEEEARVVTASRQPTSLAKAPATTYVVTAEEIERSGATTLYDALRLVPGVDVIGLRDFQGDVSIRGLDSNVSNRVQVLLDGKTVLSGYFDSLDWETLPVGLAEIDRIEIVEGPASALYGPNAEAGVINIITKKPEQIPGATARYEVGNDGLQIVDAAAGRRSGAFGYRLGAGWRGANRVDDPAHAASDAGRADGLLQWRPDADREASVSGGIVRHNTQVFGPPSGAFDNGETGFLRADGRYGETKARFFWNAGRASLTNFAALNGPTLDYDTFDALLEHAVSLPADNDLSLAAEWRRNQARSELFSGSVDQDLYSLAAEDQWSASDDISVIAGARVDHHPLAGWVLSPRASLIWSASPSSVWRVSAGDAFRNPTLIENYIHTTAQAAPGVAIQLNGASNLRPERMRTVELAWRGSLGRVEAGASIFHYTLSSLITGGDASLVSAGPPALLTETEVNRGATRAMGYQLDARAEILSGLKAFANYSYQSLKDEQGFELFAVQSPKHKGNAGLTGESGGWSAQLWVTAVDKTLWAVSGFQTGTIPASPVGPQVAARVPAYAFLNAYLGYRFAGRWDGLKLSLSAFNLTDNAHYEILPPQDPLHPGQGGELLSARYAATISYHFR